LELGVINIYVQIHTRLTPSHILSFDSHSINQTERRLIVLGILTKPTLRAFESLEENSTKPPVMNQILFFAYAVITRYHLEYQAIYATTLLTEKSPSLLRPLN
jgi:hypothetical protein